MQRQAKTFFTLPLHTVLFTLYSSHPALHTSHLHFTLHTSSHLRSCELFSPHLSSSHLIPSLLTTCHLSKFFSTVFITDQPFSSRSSSQLISAVLHARNLLLSERSLLPKKTIGRRNFCTQKLETQMHLHRKAFTNYFVLQSLHKALPSTTLYYQPCTKHFPVLLCTRKLAQSTSQYYFVLQSLHKALPSIYYFGLQCLHKYYKTCTKHFPVYTALYYKAGTKYSPVILCTTKLAQSTSQYYFVPQSLHKVFPSTTL